MSYFKDIVKKSRDHVLSADEFGEEHDIDGTKVVVILEDEEINEKDDAQALSRSIKTLYGKTEELPRRKMYGESLYIDDVAYTVETWREEMGITRVQLSNPESW